MLDTCLRLVERMYDRVCKQGSMHMWGSQVYGTEGETNHINNRLAPLGRIE